MIFFGVLFGIAIMGAVVYLALDKKSNFPTRLASLGALALMILTVIICLVIILTDNRVPVDESVLIVGEPVQVQEKNDNNLLALFISIFFFLLLFAVIAFLVLREHKMSLKK